MPEVHVKNGVHTRVGLWTGTVVKFKDGKRFKVTKLNPVNIKMMDESGKDGWSINRDYAEKFIDEDQTWNAPEQKTEYDKYLELVELGVTLGSTVKLKAATRLSSKYGRHTYVVIAMPNNGTVRLAKLGGDRGRYLRNIEAKDIEVVTV